MTTETKKNLLTIATILLLPFYKCLRLKIIFQDRRGENVLSLEKLNQNRKRQRTTKKKDKETGINRTMVSGGGGQKSL